MIEFIIIYRYIEIFKVGNYFFEVTWFLISVSYDNTNYFVGYLQVDRHHSIVQANPMIDNLIPTTVDQ